MSKLLLAALCILSSKALPATAELADLADYPYHVSVRRAGRHVCSGALVHESWIITAASCVYESNVPQMSVLLGSSDPSLPIPRAAVQLAVSKIVVHQSFDRTLLTNNIALVKVQGRKGAVRGLLPIFLPSSPGYQLREGSELLVSVWRLPEQEPSAGFESQLSVTPALLVNQRTCIRSMPRHKAVSRKMLCTRPDETTCQHDDVGAPLANHDILVGILSSDDGCAGPRLPATYTKISSFLPWISKILRLDSSE